MICNTCKANKPEDSFPINQSKKLGRGEKCLECKSLYNAAHYRANKDKYLKKSERNKIKTKQRVDKLKDKPCTDCGKKYPPYVMDFDHLHNKEFSIATGRKNGSYRAIIEEIKKCELVCANCHRERTHKRYSPMV